MEIHQNPLFFHENIFFLIRKSPNTPNSIFRANIRNLLLRVMPSHFIIVESRESFTSQCTKYTLILTVIMFLYNNTPVMLLKSE